ncbi:hypothetical protein FRACYDRAFT_246933 [Fragilariopsis cylindrus CCMP1102]|uniref:Glycine zipper domain-containing protein n=1 Tax=Fragilariopsis cylindrus CCMP1102 TaxID=635003 RepID=A0A1E7EWZ8_9STRA|nr:hypothetical protein FRACYDRAFT_246933 [Fragilariopsis cylindrus CCMP1102]|eukprot:OEU10481.1 hypothetical protein FRACYDRAFT_246933 [Fragilariopsis cylindrus CCMP1102]
MLAPESFDHSSSSSSSSSGSSHSHSHEELAMWKKSVHPLSSSPSSRSYETSSNSIQEYSIPKKKGGGYKLILPWSSSNLNGRGGTSDDDDAHTLKKKMKKDRKTKAAAGTLGGMVIGGVILGPLGVFIGGAIGGVTTQKLAKHSDRKAQRKHEKQCYQKSANEKSKHWNTNGNALFV